MPDHADLGHADLGGDVELWADASAPSRARHAFDDLSRELPNEVAERTQLLIGEAVTNGVLHGSTSASDKVGVSIQVDEAKIHVEVADTRPLSAPLAPIGPRGEGLGLGLVLIDELADRWGAEPRDHGKIVWFEFDLPT